MKRFPWLAAVTLACALAVPSLAVAQAYPDRPLKLIVPYAPGGSVDIVGRLLAAKLSESLGQQVVVENRGGGGSTIATGALAKSPPDGYTMMLGDIAFGANPALMSKLPYDPVKDFLPVALVARLPSILVVDPGLGASAGSAKDLVAFAKASPGKLNYSSAGVGSMNFLATELFKAENGVDIVHVPYQSGGQAVAAILGGQTQVLITTIPPVLQHVRAGKVKALAVAGSQRRASLPDVPTFAEAGFPSFDVHLWQGVLVPSGTSADIVARLNSEINRVLSLPDVRAKLEELGADPAGGTPEQFASFIRAEMARWNKLIKPEMRIN